jgi:hypothetical protein
MKVYALQQEASLREVGEAMGLSFERVRQIEQEALRKLRVALERAGLEADDIRAWLDSKARGANEPISHDTAPSYLRREERETLPEELVKERRARDDRRIEREVDAMVREIRATAAAHRFIERVVCAMEEGGEVRVLEERAEREAA